MWRGNLVTGAGLNVADAALHFGFWELSRFNPPVPAAFRRIAIANLAARQSDLNYSLKPDPDANVVETNCKSRGYFSCEQAVVT